jgi:hypothetical protein
MFNLDNLTIGQLKEIQNMNLIKNQTETEQPKSAFVVGGKYFIRTATYHLTGELTEIFDNELVLKDAAWIADSGRFSNALKNCEFSEVEPFHYPVIVSRLGIIDATIIDHLPLDLK